MRATSVTYAIIISPSICIAKQINETEFTIGTTTLPSEANVLPTQLRPDAGEGGTPSKHNYMKYGWKTKLVRAREV